MDSYVDLEKYSGFWYGIANLKTHVHDCPCTIAKYDFVNQVELSFINTCQTQKGDISILGRMYSNNWFKNTSMWIRFDGFYKLNQYWILDLDEDYTTVLIGTPCREMFFVMSRYKTLSREVIKQKLEIAKNNGYDFDDENDILYRDQYDCEFER